MDTRAAPSGIDFYTPNVQDTYHGKRPITGRFN
jgi:hypothetical protein